MKSLVVLPLTITFLFFIQVFEKVPFGQLTSQLSAPHLGTLFLQLTVDDMGICLPLNPPPLVVSIYILLCLN